MGRVRCLSLVGQVILGLALFSPPERAQGNVGDSLPELRGRYGSAKDMGGQMLFEVRLLNGQIRAASGSADTDTHFSVNVYFDGVHSAMEVFTRATSNPVKAEMTQADIDIILGAASDGMQWNAVVLANGKSAWVRSDNKLLARFSPNKTGKVDDASVLVIMLNSK